MWIETWNEYHKPSNSLNITTMNNTTSVSLEEVIIFMANDTTIKNTYENDSYNCTKYTTNIVNNAIDQGILAYPVRITFENETQSRVIVTFPTNDHGYVYFDSIPDTNTTYTQYEDRIVTDLDINKPMIEYNPITNTTTEIGIVDNVVMYRLEDADYPYSFDFSTGKYDSIRPLDKPSDNINNSTESMVNVAYNQTINTYEPKTKKSIYYRNRLYGFRDNIELNNATNCTPVTLEEVVKFVANDTTITHKYKYGEYDCTQFMEDMINNATKQNILAFPVTVQFTTKAVGHAIVAFPTTDKGYVYFDCTGEIDKSVSSRSDKMITNIVPGEMYIDCDLRSNQTMTNELVVKEVLVFVQDGVDLPSIQN
jgi:hypothetical protein